MWLHQFVKELQSDDDV